MCVLDHDSFVAPIHLIHLELGHPVVAHIVIRHLLHVIVQAVHAEAINHFDRRVPPITAFVAGRKRLLWLLQHLLPIRYGTTTAEHCLEGTRGPHTQFLILQIPLCETAWGTRLFDFLILLLVAARNGETLRIFLRMVSFSE